VKVREGIFPKSSRSEKDPEGGLGFLAMRCGSLVGLPVDRLGSSDILISFLLFRTQSAAADGTRTPTHTRWLESTSVEHHFVEYQYE
jgi:hypothetical protein